MRDHRWLVNKLEFILSNYFADMPITNPLEIRFGREAKFRFGSIKLLSDRRVKGVRRVKDFMNIIKIGDQPKKSVITITKMFVGEEVPVEVVEYTIAHELCHYAHGFSSNNKQLFRHPHHGGVVNAEIKKRGGEHLIMAYKKWIKAYKAKILAGRARI